MQASRNQEAAAADAPKSKRFLRRLNKTLPRLVKQRQAIQAIARLQIGLRSKLKSKKEQLNLERGEIAKQVGCAKRYIDGFLDGTSAICKGKILQGVTALVECPELAVRITTSAAGINDLVLSAASCSSQTIDLYFDLLEMCAKNEDLFTRETFAECFDPHQRIVLGMLNSRSDDLREVDTTDAGGNLREYLDSQKCKDIFARNRQGTLERLSRKHETLDSLCLPLVEAYGTRKSVIDELGVHRTTLKQALDPDASEGSLDNMINRLSAYKQELEDLSHEIKQLTDSLLPGHRDEQSLAKALQVDVAVLQEVCREYPRLSILKEVRTKLRKSLGGKDGSAIDAVSNGESAQPTPTPLGESKPVVGEVLVEPCESPDALYSRVAGAETPQGVRFVLVPGVFKHLKFQLAGELIEPTRRLVEITRAHLNLLAQIENEELRARISDVLGAEVTELNNAIELFSARHPNQLTALHEERRSLMGSVDIPVRKKTKKKRGRK